MACIQETKLSPASTFKDFPGFTSVRRGRPGVRGGGGLLTLIHHSIKFTELPTDHLFPGDSTTEHLGVAVAWGDTTINIINIYIPPASSCPTHFRPDLSLLLNPNDTTIVMGDFNAHNAAWYSSTRDAAAAGRGSAIVEAINDSNLTLLNLDFPTRLPKSGNPSSPDLTLCSPHLALDADWTPLTTLNSDHLPIIITIDHDLSSLPDPPRHTFTNFRRARWNDFLEETEADFARLPLPDACDSGERVFRGVLLKASLHHIPQGNVPHPIPRLSDEARTLIRQRDSLRSSCPTHPNLGNLEQQVSSAIASSNRLAWVSSVEDSSLGQDPGKYWTLMQLLSNKRPSEAPNQPITFGTRIHTDHHAIAKSFCQFFTAPFPHQYNRNARRVRRDITRRHPLNPHAFTFTPDHVLKAIRKGGNSTAKGPDGLTIRHLKHLGPGGLTYLTHLINHSLNSSRIPAIWKHAHIVPIPKPDKPRKLSSSYRPISLLCPAAKVLERLLLPYLDLHLPLSEAQHGFRKNRSTTTALLPLTHQIATGFNQPKPPHRTVAMSLDLSKAFDIVDQTLLLSTIANTSLDSNIVRWLAAYLRGRTATCRYHQTTSPQRNVRCGVPQGSVISPCLFNFFVSSYPNTSPLLTSYADDFTAAASSSNPQAAADALAAHAADVVSWVEEKGLLLSAPKSSVTLFTSDRCRESHLRPNIPLSGSPLPLDRTPRVLGVTFDTHFTFSPHITNLADRAQNRIRILKALAGSTWGQQQETLLITYKALIRPLFTYAAPIWFPNAPPSGVLKLQRIQNSALRIATGSLRMASHDHLHSETQVLPVHNHLSLLCSQFLLSALRPTHPSYEVVSSRPGPRARRKKETLQSLFLPSVSHLLSGGPTDRPRVDPSTYKTSLTDLHTSAVQAAISQIEESPVLQSRPPPVEREELSLPRSHRTALSQLRSGYCSFLNSYRARIGMAGDPSCPSCGAGDHTTGHLFDCPSHPTDLRVPDLWGRPGRVAEFLATLPFSSLPSLPRPPPEPPPP